MMDARKLLINLLYRATAQSSEMSGWSHRETKNSPASPVFCLSIEDAIAKSHFISKLIIFVPHV
jgi:hypothetical protein